jgi:hypothetical protein
MSDSRWGMKAEADCYQFSNGLVSRLKIRVYNEVRTDWSWYSSGSRMGQDTFMGRQSLPALRHGSFHATILNVSILS